MPTHAEVAAKLLREAAKFYRVIGEQNDALTDKMNQSARVYDDVAALVENDPTGLLTALNTD